MESKPQHWFAELKRRKVFRVAGAYLVVAWLLLQVADVSFGPMGLPEWTLTLVIALLVLGFPIACILAWAFDGTPTGFERTPDLPRETPGVSEKPVVPVPGPPAHRIGCHSAVR